MAHQFFGCSAVFRLYSDAVKYTMQLGIKLLRVAVRRGTTMCSALQRVFSFRRILHLVTFHYGLFEVTGGQRSVAILEVAVYHHDHVTKITAENIFDAVRNVVPHLIYFLMNDGQLFEHWYF